MHEVKKTDNYLSAYMYRINNTYRNGTILYRTIKPYRIHDTNNIVQNKQE